MNLSITAADAKTICREGMAGVPPPVKRTCSFPVAKVIAVPQLLK